jgi:hypothetical protein
MTQLDMKDIFPAKHILTTYVVISPAQPEGKAHEAKGFHRPGWRRGALRQTRPRGSLE